MHISPLLNLGISDDGENPDLEMGTKNVTVFKPVNEVVGFWCLVPLSTIFKLYRGGHRQLYLVEEIKVPGENP
jgi:hypothetical protein